MIRRTLAVLLAILVISTAGLSPVGTAAAQEEVSQCSDLEMLAIGASLGYGSLVNDCIQESQDVQQDLEREELHTELYSHASGQEAKNAILTDTLDNYLNDTKPIARMEAKQAYIRYLENNTDGTKSQARIEARLAVRDYYAQKQRQLIESWEAEYSTVAYIMDISQNSSTAVDYQNVTQASMWHGGTYTTQPYDNPINNYVRSGGNSSVDLVNGDTVHYDTLETDYGQTGDYYNVELHVWDHSSDPDTQNTTKAKQNGAWMLADFAVQPPPSMTTSQVVLLHQESYVETWLEIERQTETVVSGTEDFVNETYAMVDAGELTSADLVDPYLGARDYDPETNTSSWALRSLTAIGIEPPDDLQNYGNMTVRDESTGINYTGILMSDGNPPNASGFTVGATYNATNIAGSQFVATPDTGHQELDGQFTLVAAETPSGTAYGDGETIAYTSDIDYQTTNVTEFTERLSLLSEKINEIEERENKLENGTTTSTAGGSGLPEIPTGLGVPEIAIGAILLLAAAVILIGKSASGPEINLVRKD